MGLSHHHFFFDMLKKLSWAVSQSWVLFSMRWWWSGVVVVVVVVVFQAIQNWKFVSKHWSNCGWCLTPTWLICPTTTTQLHMSQMLCCAISWSGLIYLQSHMKAWSFPLLSNLLRHVKEFSSTLKHTSQILRFCRHFSLFACKRCMGVKDACCTMRSTYLCLR